MHFLTVQIHVAAEVARLRGQAQSSLQIVVLRLKEGVSPGCQEGVVAGLSSSHWLYKLSQLLLLFLKFKTLTAFLLDF